MLTLARSAGEISRHLVTFCESSGGPTVHSFKNPLTIVVKMVSNEDVQSVVTSGAKPQNNRRETDHGGDKI